MRVLTVRADHVDADVAAGIDVLKSEIQHPAKVVMVVRGTAPEVGRFADRAEARASVVPYRSVIWVQDERILDAFGGELFEAGGSACAVIVDLDDQPAEYLEPDASLYDIDRAFRTVEAR